MHIKQLSPLFCARLSKIFPAVFDLVEIGLDGRIMKKPGHNTANELIAMHSVIALDESNMYLLVKKLPPSRAA
jgi:hypothetical protein